MITIICQRCGKSFDVSPSVKNKKFCSMECRDAGKTSKSICPQCGKEFTSSIKYPKTYCSKSCARTAYNLTDKNPSHHRDISGDKNPMFGKGLRGDKNGMFGKRRELCVNWKGGKKHGRTDGYIMLRVPDDYPNPSMIDKGAKFSLEHRVIMEQYIGRYLTSEEVVHHINGDTGDNRIENLRLFANQHEHIMIGHDGITHHPSSKIKQSQ